MNLTLTLDTAVKLYALACIKRVTPDLDDTIDPIMMNYPEKARINAHVQLQAMMVLSDEDFCLAVMDFTRDTMDQLMKEVNG